MCPESGRLCSPRGPGVLMFTPGQARVATGVGLRQGLEGYRQVLPLDFSTMTLNGAAWMLSRGLFLLMGVD